MSLANRVKEARKEARLTQIELAEKAGITQARLSAIETGYTKNPTCVINIATALCVCPIWLQTGTRSKQQYPADILYDLINALPEEEKVKEIAYLERLLKNK